ncbi:MAG TPA: hypothetical protein PLY23_06910, partial [Alphaproteobacteria bacterium]|nr:hypothetical protein [Alphaproteobacteria bacterium]HQS94426.1 hypothetical protein [Alphaproteobacteria bacterium]
MKNKSCFLSRIFILAALLLIFLEKELTADPASIPMGPLSSVTTVPAFSLPLDLEEFEDIFSKKRKTAKSKCILSISPGNESVVDSDS